MLNSLPRQILYRSVAKDNQGSILRASNEDKASQAMMIRKMKSDLTATNFKLGKFDCESNNYDIRNLSECVVSICFVNNGSFIASYSLILITNIVLLVHGSDDLADWQECYTNVFVYLERVLGENRQRNIRREEGTECSIVCETTHAPPIGSNSV